VLRNCESITEFPLLPPNLKALLIRNCDQIKFIGLDDVYLKGTGIHGKIPTSLKEINFYGLKNLTWIGELPSNLEDLSINKYSGSILVMSSLPKHLESLIIENYRMCDFHFT
jgi:hypothetical protein